MIWSRSFSNHSKITNSAIGNYGIYLNEILIFYVFTYNQLKNIIYMYILDAWLYRICLKKDLKISDLDHYFFCKNDLTIRLIIWFFHNQKLRQFLYFFFQKLSRSWSHLDHFRLCNTLSACPHKSYSCHPYF